MKKFYSLAVFSAFSLGVSAQTFNATFDDVDGTGGNDGKFSGSISSGQLTSYNAGGAWGLTKAFKGSQCVKLGSGDDLGSITTPATGVVGNAVLSFRAAAWDSTNEKVNLKLSISGGGTLDAASVTMVKGSFSNYTVKISGATADSKITFTGEAAANSRFFLDDIKVDPAGSLAIVSEDFKKKNFIKNIVVSDVLSFGLTEKTQVQITNMAGQQVTSATVAANGEMNLGELPKGSYIVTANIGGESVSRKIIKR